MPEIQTKDKLITLEELGAAIDAKAGVTSVNNQTGAVSITPANIGAVAKTGDTMTGPLTVPSLSISSNGYQFIYMRDANDAEISHIRGNTTDQNISFRERTPNTSGAFEDYHLPHPTIQSGIVGYDILTNKSPVTIGQGGTGATSAASARTNLGIHSGRLSLTFTSGKATINFATVGLSARPSAFIAIGSSNSPFLLIDYDYSASTSNIVLFAGNGANGASVDGNYNISYIAIA